MRRLIHIVLALLLCFYTPSGVASVTVPPQEIKEAYADIFRVTYPLKVKVDATFQVDAEVEYMCPGFMELTTGIFDFDLKEFIDKRLITIFKEETGVFRHSFTLSAPPHPKIWYLAAIVEWTSRTDEKPIPGEVSGVEFKIQVVEEAPPPPFLEFNITVSPREETTEAGKSANFTVKVNLVSGKSATVELSLEARPKFPEGIYYMFNPDSGTPSFDSMLEITTTKEVVEGSYPFYVVGEGGGMGQKRKACLKLKVEIPPPPPKPPAEPWHIQYSNRIISLILCSISIILFVIGILYWRGWFTPPVHSIKQDAWLSDPKEPPKATLIFDFSSKGAFTANYPIHVKVRMMVSKGINVTDIMPIDIIFPDTYAHPIIIEKPGAPPTAGIVKLNSTPEGLVGEADIEFTSKGAFGYVIFSKGNPVYYAANISLIEIAPYETRLQLEASQRNHGIAFITAAIATFVALLIYLAKG